MNAILPASSSIAFQALNLARYLPVFPCDQRKRPITRHGFKDANRDQQIVDRLFRDPAAKLIGVPTGTASGTVVVDIDVKNGAPGAAWLHEHCYHLPVTRTHRTPSGGQHLVFRYPAGGLDIRSTAGVVAPGVDIRGNGGYACWAGCGGYIVMNGSRAAELPAWLLPLLLRPAPRATRPAPAAIVQADQFGRYGAFIARLLENVRQAPEGAKHYALLRHGRTLGGVLGAADMGKDDAIAALVDALPDTVTDWAAAKVTAAWAVEKGMAEPLELEDRPRGVGR